MKGFQELTARAMAKKRGQSVIAPDEAPLCSSCGDTGWVVTEGKASWCSCWQARLTSAKLQQIPPLYREANIDTMVANPAIHPLQSEVLTALQSGPFESYLLLGTGGVGKSHFLWALCRKNLESGRPVFACSAIRLLEQYRASLTDRNAEVTIRGSWLRSATQPVAIFIDDVDKARPSEYAAEQLYDLIDAAYAGQHQLVATSNLDVPVLQEHFERADERYGLPIVRRLADSTVVRMF